jgi:hypothetical protein
LENAGLAAILNSRQEYGEPFVGGFDVFRHSEQVEPWCYLLAPVQGGSVVVKRNGTMRETDISRHRL